MRRNLFKVVFALSVVLLFINAMLVNASSLEESGEPIEMVLEKLEKRYDVKVSLKNSSGPIVVDRFDSAMMRRTIVESLKIVVANSNITNYSIVVKEDNKNIDFWVLESKDFKGKAAPVSRIDKESDRKNFDSNIFENLVAKQTEGEVERELDHETFKQLLSKPQEVEKSFTSDDYNKLQSVEQREDKYFSASQYSIIRKNQQKDREFSSEDFKKLESK